MLLPSPLPCLAFLQLIANSQQAGPGFSRPGYVPAYGTGKYQDVDVWYVGQTKEVVYNLASTGLKDYTISLWQQDVTKASASKGPVVNSVTASETTDSFSWTVSLLNFDLDTSNVFFFWIFNGTSSSHGGTSQANVPSAYFNISTADPPSSSSSVSESTAATTSSTQLSSTASTRADAAVSTSSTAVKSSTATSSTFSATTSATQMTQTSTGSDSPAAAAANTSNAPSSSTSPSPVSGSIGGLSTGAVAGIGVSVGIGVICAVICAVVIAQGRQRKAQAQANTSGAFKELHELPSYINPASQGDPPGMYQANRTNLQATNQDRPAELYSRGGTAPAELSAGPRGF